MQVELRKYILAVITTSPNIVSGGVPVFIANTGQERDNIAFALSRILDAMVHDLGNGTLILVKH